MSAVREQTVTDYWHAVQLAWTWFGLPHARLDYSDFRNEALPVPAEADPGRAKLLESLQLVNAWLADRPRVFAHAVAALPAGEESAPAGLPGLPPTMAPPTNRRVLIWRPQPVDVPAQPQPPHGWMLVAAAATVIASVAAAFLAPGPEITDIVIHSSAPTTCGVQSLRVGAGPSTITHLPHLRPNGLIAGRHC